MDLNTSMNQQLIESYETQIFHLNELVWTLEQQVAMLQQQLQQQTPSDDNSTT